MVMIAVLQASLQSSMSARFDADMSVTLTSAMVGVQCTCVSYVSCHKHLLHKSVHCNRWCTGGELDLEDEGRRQSILL